MGRHSRGVAWYGDGPYTEHMTAVLTRDARLDLRMTAEARATIERAASQNGLSLTEYVLGLVLPAARRDLLEARTVHLSQQGWQEFVDFLDGEDNARAKALRAHEPQWGVERT